MATHHYTDKTYYEYDATLTQDLLTKYINTLSSSSATKTDMTYLWSIGNMSRFTGSRHEPNPEVTSGESEEPRPSTVTHDYVNFVNATGVDFDQARSAAVAAGLSANTIPNGIGLNDIGLQATNITFAEGGAAGAYASNTTLSNLTFLGRGGVVEIGGGFVDDANGSAIFVGGQSLNGLKAEEDLDKIILYPPSKQAATSAVTATNITVSRNLTDLAVAAVTRYGYYGAEATSNRPGTGVVASKITVHGALRYVNIGSGALVDGLTVGDWKEWGDGEASAFLGEDVWGSTSHMSATYMNVYSGGTATNINLGFGGSVFVSGPGMIYSSQLVSSGGQSWYEYTSSEGTGAGGVLTDLKMAVGGGIQFTGGSASELNQKLWDEPRIGYGNRPYMSGYLAGAPQSAYVEFGKFTSGSNINIGNGGSIRIDSGARVSAISMGGLTTSTTFVNSSGTTDTWIGDRGASLQIRGGYVSGVVMDPVLQTFDYYSATHDYFWLHSETIKDAYSSAHGSYGSGEAWSSAMYASASATYRQYMSAMYNSGAVYTNLGDDTAYNRRYVGGDIGVAGGWIMNVSGFSYLGVAADVDVTVSNNVSTWKTYQYTDGNVSKAIGAVSATLDVTGGAHVYNVKIEGGRVIMTGGGEVNARWHSRENKQSNYNLVEDLDLRIGDVLGLGSAYPAVIEFFGEGSGGYKQYISSGGTSGYVDYTWDAIDPGEIHSATTSKGLVVTANWNKQDFTYIGSGAVTFNGLGTVVLKDNHARETSDSYYGKGPYLGSAYDEYYFGVVKGVYNEEDGTLENYTVLDGDVSSGGFDWEGFLMVGSGGIVQNIGSASPLKTGNDIVNSDTWTPEYTRDKCKVLTVVAGGLADNVTVKGAVSNYEHNESQYTESRAGLLVSSGGTATNVTVLEGGIAMAKGGTIDKVFVAAGGVLYLSGWAGAHQVGERDSDYNLQLSGPQYMDTTVLNGVRLDSGGQLTNTLDWGFRAGNAPSVIANKGGGIMNGVTANGVAYVSGLDYAGGITLTKDQQAIDVTVRGYKKITSRDEEGNPTAYTTVIASLNVSSGGIVKGATVGDEGAIYASNGAVMSGLVASGGRIIFANSSGWSDYFAGSATVNGITVKDGGSLQVNSKFGLTATDVKIEQDAGLEFTLGKTANEDYTPTALNGTWTADWGNGTFQTNDGVLTGFGGEFGFTYVDPVYSRTYTSNRLGLNVLNGGVLSGGDLRGYGSVLVKNGGKMLDTKLQGVGASIATSGYASGLSATVASGKNAYGTNIYVYGSGAVAEATVLNGGYMGVERGGVVNSVTMLCPEGYEGPAGNDTQVGPVEFEVMAGGTANNVNASAGVITLLDGSKEPGTAGPTLSNADVHSAAMLIVKGDGAVLDGTLNLAGTVFTTGKRYEYVEVEVTDPNTGDTYTDWQRVELNNSIADAATLTVNFDLTERTGEEEGAMIDNLANLTGVTLDRITVKADQTQGAYVLAGGSEDYQGALKVVRDSSFAGTITVGGYLQVTDALTYSLLKNDNNDLVFSVMSTEAAITDIIATSDGKELLKGKWSKYAVNIKTEVNQYSKSIWYRIKQAVKPKTRGHVLYAPGDVDDDGWIEFDNEKGITISEYCTVELKAKNEAGADSEIVEYTVNYDATAPEFSDLHLVSGDQFLTPGVESQVSVLVWDELDPAPKMEFSLDGEEWTVLDLDETSHATFTVMGGIECFTLRSTDHADNVNTLFISTPVAPTVSADILTVTNQDVTVSARFGADAMIKEFSTDGGQTWNPYEDGVVLEDNGTVSFRAGNILGYSAVTDLTVDYIDKDAPTTPSGLQAIVDGQSVTLSWTASTDKLAGVKEYIVTYSHNEQVVTAAVNETSYVLTGLASGSWSWSVQAIDLAGNESALTVGDGFVISGEIIEPVSDVIPQTQTWEAVEEAAQYIVEYSTDNFEHVIQVAVNTNSLDSFQMPAGNYQMRVKADGVEEWTVAELVIAEGTTNEPKLIKSNADGNADVFFVNEAGTWGSGFVAQHVGSTDDKTWDGTKEIVTVVGRNKLSDIVEGSTDANVLLMTDDSNGDALFVDDIYSASPDELGLSQSRIAQIDEIRAGAGDDIVDMTSHRFEYTGDGLTIRGGDGNDTIWANKGDNFLFGDADNDRIVGASGNDVITGGIGNDRMHGGGGNDVFTFCDNWGMDTVEQLAGGSVTLWFANGDESKWNAETLTYTDGDNTVTVKGVASVTLKFGGVGDDAAMFATLSEAGAFKEFTSQKIFEENKGLLA